MRVVERLSTGWTTGDVLGPAIIAIMDDGMAASRTGLRLRPPTVEIGEDIAPFVRLDAIRANVTDAAAERLAVFQTPCDRHLVDRLVIGEIASAPSAAHALRIKELYETNNLFYAPRIETHFTFAIDIWDDCASTHFCRHLNRNRWRLRRPLLALALTLSMVGMFAAGGQEDLAARTQ